MAVVDNTVGDGYELPNNMSGQKYTLKQRIDTATTNVTGSDVLKTFIIPADTVVDEVILIVRAPEGAALTANVGDYLIATDVAVDADGYLAASNCNATAGTAYKSLAVTTTYGGGGGAVTYGKVYTSRNSYIGIALSADADAAILDLIVNCTFIGENEETNTY